jgi:hypothetical protein
MLLCYVPVTTSCRCLETSGKSKSFILGAMTKRGGDVTYMSNENLNENLTTYLKDHQAGSVAALELVDHLIEIFEGKSLEQFFKNLRKEIDADQVRLQELIIKVGAKESAIRKAGAWVAEKFARMKVRVNDSGKDQMGLLDALEALLIGITGKEALWSALEAASKNVASLRGVDYARLRQRAREQCDLVDTKRLECAREVFKTERT